MRQIGLWKKLKMMPIALAAMISFSACSLIDGNSGIEAFSGTFRGQEWPLIDGIATSPEYSLILTFDDSGNYTLQRWHSSSSLEGTYSGKARMKKGDLVMEDPYNDTFDIAGDINEDFELIGSNVILYNMYRE